MELRRGTQFHDMDVNLHPRVVQSDQPKDAKTSSPPITSRVAPRLSRSKTMEIRRGTQFLDLDSGISPQVVHSQKKMGESMEVMTEEVIKGENPLLLEPRTYPSRTVSVEPQTSPSPKQTIGVGAFVRRKSENFSLNYGRSMLRAAIPPKSTTPASSSSSSINSKPLYPKENIPRQRPMSLDSRKNKGSAVVKDVGELFRKSSLHSIADNEVEDNNPMQRKAYFRSPNLKGILNRSGDSSTLQASVVGGDISTIVPNQSTHNSMPISNSSATTRRVEDEWASTRMMDVNDVLNLTKHPTSSLSSSSATTIVSSSSSSSSANNNMQSAGHQSMDLITQKLCLVILNEVDMRTKFEACHKLTSMSLSLVKPALVSYIIPIILNIEGNDWTNSSIQNTYICACIALQPFGMKLFVNDEDDDDNDDGENDELNNNNNVNIGDHDDLNNSLTSSQRIKFENSLNESKKLMLCLLRVISDRDTCVNMWRATVKLLGDFSLLFVYMFNNSNNKNRPLSNKNRPNSTMMGSRLRLKEESVQLSDILNYLLTSTLTSSTSTSIGNPSPYYFILHTFTHMYPMLMKYEGGDSLVHELCHTMCEHFVLTLSSSSSSSPSSSSSSRVMTAKVISNSPELAKLLKTISLYSHSNGLLSHQRRRQRRRNSHVRTTTSKLLDEFLSIDLDQSLNRNETDFSASVLLSPSTNDLDLDPPPPPPTISFSRQFLTCLTSLSHDAPCRRHCCEILAQILEPFHQSALRQLDEEFQLMWSEEEMEKKEENKTASLEMNIVQAFKYCLLHDNDSTVRRIVWTTLGSKNILSLKEAEDLGYWITNQVSKKDRMDVLSLKAPASGAAAMYI